MSHLTVSDAPAWHRHRHYPILRLITSLAIATVGNVGMYIVVVVLPDVQAQFGIARTGASLPFTWTMIGFGLGGVAMGPLVDRYRITRPVMLGAVFLGSGMFLASQADSVIVFGIASFLIGIGCSANFAPLVADISLWFDRRRGIAVALVASGNYLSGAIWPPIIQAMVADHGWQFAYQFCAVFCFVLVCALSLLLRPVPPILAVHATPTAAQAQAARITADADRPLGMHPNVLQGLLLLAGISCCVAMSMPQVHIVALCADLGYGTARGAQMLSVMLACGIVSRLVFGWISDYIGGAATLFLSASLQAVALALFLPNQSLDILFVVSALFGLFQGGIVPSYALIVRQYFRPEQAATRVGLAIAATLLGMALGGWASGAIFDWTSSYDAAFVHGIAWNLITVFISGMLIVLHRRRYGAIMA
ncbi:MAG: transporter [Alphaproteobacteria bacterium]|nr:transporter [Alphaproteobacteria bacterium]